MSNEEKIKKRGGLREGAGRKPKPLTRRPLIIRCGDKDWKIIKSWHSGKAEKRAEDILQLINESKERSGNEQLPAKNKE
jgi:hypothetical protein